MTTISARMQAIAGVLVCLAAFPCAWAQTTNPTYLSAMPSVDKVRELIKGSNLDDTLARQLTVFTYIPQMIAHMREATRPYGSPWTPDETRIVYAYNVAAKQITDDYGKTHTKEQLAELGHMEGHYELMDDQFYKEWTKALFPADFLQAYNKAAWGMLKEYQAHVEQEQKVYEAAKAQQQAAAQQSGTPGFANDAGSVAVRRCMELGGGPLSCLGKGMTVGLFDLAGLNPSETGSSSRNGPTLTGKYSGGTIQTDFDDNSVTLSGCGNLVPESIPYVLEYRDGRIMVHVQNSPAPFTMALGGDGRLAGPGLTSVNGKIVTGVQHYWVYKYYRDSGAQVPGSGHEVSVPIYSAKTEQCSIATLAPTGRSLPNEGVASALADVGDKVIAGQSGANAMQSFGSEMPDPGIRLQGVYSSRGGLKAEFDTASVVLDCGQAHVRDKYTVTRTGGQVLIQVENPAGAFMAKLQPDGSLAGPASVAVAGRVVTGMAGDQLSYAARNASCPASRLLPNGTPMQFAAEPASAPSQPAATSTPASKSSGDAQLSVIANFPAGSNPLAGKQIFLMKDRLDNIARNAGIQVAANASQAQAWEAIVSFCKPPKDCSVVKSKLDETIAVEFTLPAGGRGSIPSGVPEGTYYLSTFTPVNNKIMVWDLKMDLKRGENSIVLDDHNGEFVN